MSNEKLRETAILLHDWVCDGEESIKYKTDESHPWWGGRAMRKESDAWLILAKHVLATVHADDHLPVDETWLRGEWGFSEWTSCAVRLVDNHHIAYHTDPISLWVDDLQAEVTTRKQFRALMEGLSIKAQR